MALVQLAVFLFSIFKAFYSQPGQISSNSITLSNSNTDFGSEWEGAKVIFEDTPNCVVCLVTLEGVILLSNAPNPIPDGFLIGQLPINARPVRTLIFNARSRIGSARIDINSDGQILLCRFGDCSLSNGNWLSLNGISFYVGNSAGIISVIPVPLRGGTTVFGSEWEEPKIVFEDSATCTVCIVSLEGLVRLPNTAIPSGFLIGQLPLNARPPKTLIFNTRSGIGSVRIDINSDGQILVCDKGDCTLSAREWVSLDGISYYVGSNK